MKNIFFALLFISTSLWAQDYEKNWNKVIEFESADKIKSANEEVQRIYAKAKQKGIESEVIKAFFYTSKYLQKLDENAQSKILANLKKETTELSLPSQSILCYIYAKCLETHLSQNRNKIDRLTATDSIYNDDFRTWPVRALKTEIKKAYEKSIANEDILQKTPLLHYELIFDFLKYEDFKESTVFDFLGSEVISYYTRNIENEDADIKNIENDKALFFDTSGHFKTASLDFIKNKNVNRILTLYQKLEKNIKKRQEHQFNRLVFCKTHLFNDNGYYLKSLSQFQKNHLYNEILQKVLFEKAGIYQNTASKKEFPNNNIIAVQFYDSILNLSRSVTYKKALLAKNRITSKLLELKLLKQVYDKEHSRAFITYKNVDNITFSFYKIGQDKFNNKKFNSWENDSIADIILKSKTPAKKVTYALENRKDYFSYTTEVLLPQLETGHYLVYMESAQKNDSIKTKAFDYETLTVTNLSLLSHSKGNKIYYQALDRKTGIPIEEVKIQSDDFMLFTDENGKAETRLPKENYYYVNSVLATKDNDSLRIKKDYVSHFSNKNDGNGKTTKSKIEFYLDRAIYRPGQTVYYKGIALLQKGDQSNVVPNLLVKITLEDADDNETKELEVTTNEFGSFSGEFILPKTGMTGDFTIIADEPDEVEKDLLYDLKNKEHPFWNEYEDHNSKITFKVEEYKRPKFEITFNPVKETYVVNQKVSVRGNARAFSGSNLSDAKITYKIDRNSYRNYRSYSPDETTTITQGEAKTNASGDFIIHFITEPEEDFTQETLPVFSYTISVSVTDINGETRSNETSVKVGYHSLHLGTELPAKIETSKKQTLVLNSENLNNQFIPVKGQLQFYFTGPISNKWKNRNLGNPEIKTISDTEFEQLFPYEKNTGTHSPEETLIFTKPVNTETDKNVLLDFMSFWKTGNYKVVFSAKDSFGNPVEDISSFKLLQSNDKEKPSEELFTIKMLNENPKKDGFALLEINSNFGDLHINSSAFYNDIEYSASDIQLQDHKARIRVPIKNNFRSGVAIQFQTIFENQPINKEFPIPLFEETPKLQFEVENFRNKLEPNSKENWVFKIKGSAKNEAEVLASMYDSSLDQFTTKDWQFLDFKNYFSPNASEKTTLGFETSFNSLKYFNNDIFYNPINDRKTNLLWFGFNFSNPNDYYSKRQYELLVKNGKSRIPSNAKLVTGIVNDMGNLPLPGVTVMVKGTARGTQTDFDGSYQIDMVQGEELIFSFMGMKDKTIKVTSKIHNIALQDDDVRLSEVVVTSGYSMIKSKKSLAYSTSTISQQEFFARANILESLSGEISGLNVIHSDGTPGSSTKVIIRGMSSISGNNEALIIIDGIPTNADALSKISASEVVSTTILKQAQATALYGSRGANGVIIITTKKELQELTSVQARKNLNETAFFFPHLKTDKNGRISFSFSSPEALTQWKLRLLAHNKKAVSGYYEKTVVTQKEVMVTPNFPRFLREKDTVFISAKIANLTPEAKTGIAVLQLFDAVTMEGIDNRLSNTNSVQSFAVTPKGNTIVTWKIAIPEGLQGLQYKVLAKAGNFSDGEENILPVLTNNILVTESIPIWVRENSRKEYSFENLKNSTSTTLRNHQFTFEYTSNPTWPAIQSLPYLMEYEHECAEQTFARFYANTLASEIISSNPKIAAVFETWKNNGKLTSKLEQNEELKSTLLAETPWLLDAQNEDEKKKNLGLLFDLDKMKNSLEETFGKLEQKQKASGGFAWFDGGEENEYITRHILAGFGHLQKLSKSKDLQDKTNKIAKTGVAFIDSRFLEAHKKRTANLKDKNKIVWLNPNSDLHYLYARSFYLKEYPLPENIQKIIPLYIGNIKENWTGYSLYEKGMTALILNRFDETTAAKNILEGLKETSSNNEDWGMYWIANKAGYSWYQAPIETQALLIEAFVEVTNETKSIDAMKVWLLKNKQTQNWPTTKSTTEAVYALLMQGTDWLSVKDNTIIKIGDEKSATKKMTENQKEAETGYLKLTWKANEIKKEMASITVENKSKVPGFGGAYWQYFEDLDNIKTNLDGALSVAKELYLKKNNGKEEVLQKITTNNPLKIGDLVTVRLIISSKEDIEFVHLKDMRASCFEPINVISEYKYENGLGYYMSTKDTATHLFFDRINKGTYVLEYDIRVNNAGDFSNGITTIQSMYAPEYTSHTKGIRVTAKEQ